MDSAQDAASGEAGGTATQVERRTDEALDHLSGTLAEQASTVSREVYTQADKVVGDAKAQLREKAEGQLAQVADGLDRLHRQTRALAEGRIDEAGPLVDYAQEGADRVGQLAQRIRQGGLDGVVVDVKRFARRRPVVFLAGSALVGLAIGRLLRNEAVVQARQAQNQLPAGGADDTALRLDAAADESSDQVPTAPTVDAGR